MPESPLTDEERELTKGMPIPVAIGYIAAKRAAERGAKYKKLADDLSDLQDSMFKRDNNSEEERIRRAFANLAESLSKDDE